MARSFLFVPLLVMAALAPARSARADSASEAKDLFARGRDLRSRGDCAAAVPLFRKAYAVYPSALGSLRNLAVCEEAIGHFTSAHRAWADLKQALVTTKDSKYDGWGADADAATTRLAPKVSYLTIDVDDEGAGGANAVKVVVTVDDEAVADSLFGTPLARDAGPHVIRAQRGWAGADDETTREEHVDLGVGETKHVTLHVPAAVTAAVAPPPAAPSPAPAPPPEATSESAPADASSGHGTRTAAWVALGVGAAGVIGTVVALAVRQQAVSDVEGACPGYASGPCVGNASTLANVHNDANRGGTASTLVNVFGAVGVVGIATGVVLFAVSGHHDSTPASPADQASLVLTPGGASLVGRF